MKLRPFVRDVVRGRLAPAIPLGAAFWAAYWEADGCVGSPPSAWPSRLGSATFAPGNAPTIGAIGTRKAARCEKASTQSFADTVTGALASGDDTAFTVAWHGVEVALASSNTIWAVSSVADAVHYYRCRVASTAAHVTCGGRDGVVGVEAVGGGNAAIPAAGTEYTGVFVRHGDTYDIWINGAAAVTGGALALASLGVLNRFSCGALIRSTGASLPGDSLFRRLAFAVGDSITSTQVAALHAAWIGK